MICLLAVVFVSCGRTLSQKMDKQINNISKMAELGTVEYTITKIVKANNKVFYKIGDRKILFSCKATMKAGIDLNNFSADNVKINNEKKSVKVILPKAQVLAFNMPPEKAQLVYQKVSGLRHDFTVEERNELLRQGEENILTDIENLGILEEAEKNAKSFFETLLTQMGFSTITIDFDRDGNQPLISALVTGLRN